MEERSVSDHSYGQFLNEGRLMGSKCRECDLIFLPPRPICIKCHGSDMEWVEMEGKGNLSAFTCITVGPPFMMAEGYDRRHPYCVGVVQLKEGVRVDARIEGVDTNRPEKIKVGIPLSVKFLQRGEKDNLKTYLAFEAL